LIFLIPFPEIDGVLVLPGLSKEMQRIFHWGRWPEEISASVCVCSPGRRVVMPRKRIGVFDRTSSGSIAWSGIQIKFLAKFYVTRLRRYLKWK